MITDILTKPCTIEIENKTYSLEYDNKAYAKLEMNTGKGVFQIYDSILNNTLTLADYFEIVLCGLDKHNKSSQISTVKRYMDKNPSLIMQYLPTITVAFLTPLTPPSVLNKVTKSNVKKK